MEHVVLILEKLNGIGGPWFIVVVLIVVLNGDARAWLMSRVGGPKKNGNGTVKYQPQTAGRKLDDTDEIVRVNGHPCALHKGLVASIQEITNNGNEHHREQQAGIDRIHTRIDELYRDFSGRIKAK